MTKPASVILEGSHVRLRPLDPTGDAMGLFRVSCGDPIVWGSRRIPAFDSNTLIWKYLFDGPMASEDEMREAITRRVSTERALCFCVVDCLSDRLVGMANFASNYPEHRRIELGGLWLSPIVHGTSAAAEMVFLMLEHLFLNGYQRVEWKCDANNAKSCKVALKFGFTFEGVQERHMIIKGNPRDTAWYRMLREEWVERRSMLIKMIEIRNMK